MLAMQQHIATADSCETVWIVEHPACYTYGTNAAGLQTIDTNIPVYRSDRGGLMTYHGLGQLVVYPLLRLDSYQLHIRKLVQLLEECAIAVFASFHLAAYSDPKRPGVYVAGKKIASLGIRIRNRRCLHGISLNIDMDLSAFSNIDPCGFAGLQVSQLADYTNDFSIRQVSYRFISQLCARLAISYTYQHLSS